MGLLLLLSVLAALASFMFVSEATMGVWVLGAACWLAILARLMQAEKQHTAVMRVLRRESDADTANILSGEEPIKTAA